MDDRHHLHEHERLLVSMRPSGSHLLMTFFWGTVDAVLGTVLLSIIVALIAWFGFQTTLALPLYVVLFFCVLALVWWHRFRKWAHSSFRVTTERILLQHHESFFSFPLTTIKWPQYQESFLGHRGVFDIFFRARPVCLRYGTADAHMKTCFPALPYAQDLKHYLDKVDSAIRSGKADELKPFVPKPRGKRG